MLVKTSLCLEVMERRKVSRTCFFPYFCQRFSIASLRIRGYLWHLNGVFWHELLIQNQQWGQFWTCYHNQENETRYVNILKNKSTPQIQLRIQLFVHFWWRRILEFFFSFFPMQICELQVYALMPNWHVWCMHLTFFSRQSNHTTLF